MTYDLFYFFFELDLLEIRLNILDDYVDKFVLVEASTTHFGEKKESYYLKNKDRFSRWNHKITHYIVDDFPNDEGLVELALNNSNIGNGEHYWVREFYLKESAKKAIRDLGDDDIVFVSDLDEIWNPNVLKDLTDFSDGYLNRPIQLAYYYYLNNRCSEERGWTGTIVCKYKTIKDNCLNDLRTRSKTVYREIPNGGWHFGFMGGVEGARNKLLKSNHPEYNQYLYTIEERVCNNQDYRGRNYQFWLDESELPKYILDNKKKYADFFK